MPKVPGACCALILSCAIFPATTIQAKEKPIPPGLKIERNNTPLQQSLNSVQSKIEAKLEKAKNHPDQDKKDKCLKAVNESDPDKRDRAIAKFCDVMQTKKNKDAQEEPLSDHNGKKIGKKIKTEHTIYLGHPRNRYIDDPPPGVDPERWDDIKYTGRPTLHMAGADPKTNPSSIRVRNATLSASDGINDDHDCIDRVTQDHFGGVTVPNGDAQSCFDSAGVLKVTLEFNSDDHTCQHIATEKTFSAEQCETFGATSLLELIDEDNSEGASLNVDDDLDGVIDEDGPNLDTADSACERAHGVRNPKSEACDFTGSVNKTVQDQLNAHDKVKFFKTNAAGECDSTDAEGQYECGQEPREVVVEETLAVRCPPNSEYIEDAADGVGRCKIPVANPKFAATSIFDTTRSMTPDAMMGFTFAPPALEWGINETWRVCFIWCVDVLSIRFGYEFDVAAGLRLPVRVTIDGIPEEALAGQTRTLNTSLEPLDYTVGEYTRFCHDHNLDRDWWISDCDRFAFPEFLEAMLPQQWFPPADRQGSEFVAHSVVFAGLKITVLGIPVVNYAIDSNVDIPAICTLNNIFKKIKDGDATEWLDTLMTFGENLDSEAGRLNATKFLRALESTHTNCSSFTTPWGYKDGNLRQFPFLESSITIPSDCISAKFQKVGSKEMKMCTGLAVSIYGATLGLGLELKPEAGSKKIITTAAITGDALQSSSTISYVPEESAPFFDVTFDNYTEGTDTARITLDDFVYHLDTFQVQVNGLVELGGILSFIGKVATIPLITVNFIPDGVYIPIPQHPGTGPIEITVPVINYALKVDAYPQSTDPNVRVDDDTLIIQPGTPGLFEIKMQNEGTAVDSMVNTRFELSNQPTTGTNYIFGINKNNDFDCESLTTPKIHYVGDPSDGNPDDCFDAQGNSRTDRKELIDEDGYIPGAGNTVEARDDDHDGIADEDPVDVWNASLSSTTISDVPAHSTSTNSLALSVTPFKHPLTKPGFYPVKIVADSDHAKLYNLNEDDPLHIRRTDAFDVVKIQVQSFYDPQVVVFLDAGAVDSMKPGGSTTFVVEAVNGGNVPDRYSMKVDFIDSDTSNCTLTSNGAKPECPYRALVTEIDLAWTKLAEFDTVFPPTGDFQSLGNARDKLPFSVPADWMGMADTVYDFKLTGTSNADPTAKAEFLAHLTILATKQSMTRYLNLEIAEFMAEIEKADAAGIRSKGVQPVMLHPVTMMTTKALEQILAGDLGSASKSLSSATKVMEAVVRMVAGSSLPEPYGVDWNARAAAILADMTKAQSSMIQ
jgi:hypothetical protein